MLDQLPINTFCHIISFLEMKALQNCMCTSNIIKETIIYCIKSYTFPNSNTRNICFNNELKGLIIRILDMNDASSFAIYDQLVPHQRHYFRILKRLDQVIIDDKSVWNLNYDVDFSGWKVPQVDHPNPSIIQSITFFERALDHHGLQSFHKE